MVIKNIYSFLKLFCYTLSSFFLFTNTVISAEFSEKLHINGYFTLDATITDEDVSLISNSDHAIVNDKNSLNLDNSLIGAQVSYSFTDNFTGVIQGKIYDEGKLPDAKNNSIAQIDWAYVTYEFGADLKARAGRFLIPLMKGNELRSVGFSRIWARPLLPNSGTGGYKNYTGLEVLKHVSTGKGNWDIQVAVGQADHYLDTIDNKYLGLLSLKYQQDSFWIRSAILSTQFDIFTRPGELIKDNATAIMFSTEAEYTINNVLINAGYTKSNTDIAPNDTNYYLSLAYNFDSLVPYIYHSRFKQQFNTPNRPPPSSEDLPEGPPPNGPPPNGPPPEGPPPRGLSPDDDVNIFHWVVGTRYNFCERYALKFQLEHIKDNKRANVSAENGKGNAFSIVLEGIF